MKSTFFRKTALGNIRKNYRFFIPRILSETGLLSCFYIALTLMLDERLSQVKGGSYIPVFMGMGVIVLGILSIVLMFYINSFLMKQRKRELGLYNVLGMEKRHVCRVLLHETLLSSLVSLAAGLCGGMLLYKLCSLLICRLLQTDIIVGFYFIKPLNLFLSALFFALLDGVTYLCNVISIHRMKPVELLASKAAGEREPKVKWLLLVLGLLTLGGGYYLAVSVHSPLEALILFFAAVLLVIFGTYFLFVSGSIFVLKALKGNKAYYYTARHMPAVSGMLYRMKQNAVGLASIAILATGVLVMISTTVSLYSGMQETMDKNYPQQLFFEVKYGNRDNETIRVPVEDLEAIARTAAERSGVEIREVIPQADALNVAYLVQENELLTQYDNGLGVDPINMPKGLASFFFITQQSYFSIKGEDLRLAENEVAICPISLPTDGTPVLTGSLKLHGKEYRIAEELTSFPAASGGNQLEANIYTAYGVVVANAEVLQEIYEGQRAAYGSDCSEPSRSIAVGFADREQATAMGDTINRNLWDAIYAYFADCEGYDDHCWLTVKIDTYWDTAEMVLGMYGTLLFLGILLGTVCLFATLLIIYYKQISEGYEDRERFQIMQKIGMSKEEIRRNINSQVRMVFFLPLVVAGVHMAFAFPMLEKMLRVLLLPNTMVFVVGTLVTFAAFAVIYTAIYSATARTYYKIVN